MSKRKERLAQRKRQLRSYGRLKRAVVALQRSVREQKTFAKVKGSQDEHPYSEVEFTVYGTDRKQAEEVRGEIREMRQEMAEIESFVNGIEDPYIRSLVRRHYLEGQSWAKVAEDMGSGSIDSVRKVTDRYLARI